MSEIETALMLRLEASLARFEKQMAQARKVGSDTVTEIQRQFDGSNKKMARSAEQSAQTIGREMDRLRAKYDPLFAASKRYERELDELNRAHKVGALNASQYDSALERLNAEYARSTGSAQRMVGVTRRLTTTTRGMGGGIQNVAFQVGDFATQVGAGTSASIALGQQLPQLLGGFGALGAVLGAVVAIGVPLAASFFKSGKEAESLKEKQDQLTQAVNDYRAAVDAAKLPTEELAQKYGTATVAAKVFLGALRDLNKATALEELADSQVVGSIDTSRLETLLSILDGVSEDTRAFSANYRAALNELNESFGVTEQQARTLMAAIREYETAEGPKEVLAASERLLSVIEDTYGPLDSLRGQAQALAKEVQAVAIEAAVTQGIIEDTSSATQAMVDAMSNAAGALSSAIGPADAMLGRINALADAAWDFVGAMGAARNARDREVGRGRGGDPRKMGGSFRDWQKPENLPVRVERPFKRPGAVSRPSGGSAAAGGGLDPDPLFSIAKREMEKVERQIEMIGKTKAEIAALTAQYALLDEAKKRGLDLDERQAATGKTLREEIEGQAAAIGDLTDKYEQAVESAEFYERIQGNLKDGMIDAIVEGENFSGVLRQLAKDLAKAALQAALFNEGPFASGSSGGGILGNIFSSIFSGPATPSAKGNVFDRGALTAFASGGIVDRPTTFPMRGGTGLMGEAGPEAIMPLKRGPGGKLGVEMHGASGVSVNQSFTVHAGAGSDPRAIVAALKPAMKEAALETYGRMRREGR